MEIGSGERSRLRSRDREREGVQVSGWADDLSGTESGDANKSAVANTGLPKGLLIQSEGLVSSGLALDKVVSQNRLTSADIR